MLTHLNLRTNPGLSGEIPDALGDLGNLRVLNLHSNSHTGAVPDLRRHSGSGRAVPGQQRRLQC